jgi:hypothetical protein
MPGETQVLIGEEVIWPLVAAFLLLFLTVLVKLLLHAEATKRENRSRAATLFRAFFIAPDLLVLSLSMLISSQALRAVIDSKKVSSNYGGNFTYYLMALVVLLIIALVFVAVTWLRGNDAHMSFPLQSKQEIAYKPDGTSETLTVYDIQIFKGLKARAGFWNLGVSNLIGVASVVVYAMFIYYGFFASPPWLQQ